MTKPIFPTDKQGRHADGVYFGMPNDEYHADTALGSTLIKTLRPEGGGFDYWYGSHLNPKRPRAKETDPLKVGSAYHAIVLEGAVAFDRSYIRRPDDDDDAKPSDKSATTKASNEVAAKAGKESLHGDDYDRAVVAADLIHGHPDLNGAFTGGMPEVSLFFTDGFGIRQKVRFDYLKVKGFGDLKSIANERRRPIALACKLAIKDYRIDMSIAHYLRGRKLLPGLVAEGLVYGDHDAAWLKKVCAQKTFAAQLVFLQKTGAPQVWSKVWSPANPMMVTATDHVDEGLARYRDCMERFGPDRMWVDAAEVNELDETDMPKSFFYDNV